MVTSTQGVLLTEHPSRCSAGHVPGGKVEPGEQRSERDVALMRHPR
ncbi:hypothetical protein ACQPX6_00225 [Actinomycetospora sp. CA-101289]